MTGGAILVRMRALLTDRQMAEEVFRALSGAKTCLCCKNARTEGKIVAGGFFCSDCDRKHRFIWPDDALPWHA